MTNTDLNKYVVYKQILTKIWFVENPSRFVYSGDGSGIQNLTQNINDAHLFETIKDAKDFVEEYESYTTLDIMQVERILNSNGGHSTIKINDGGIILYKFKNNGDWM